MSAPVAYLVDLCCVLAFAAAGRASHGEDNAVVGVAVTAWPFVAGLSLGWLAVLLRGQRPLSVRAAVPVWASTLVAGMALRALTGRGVAASFILVAATFLALFLFGWRAVATRVARPA